jgi:hypothetical protein
MSRIPAQRPATSEHTVCTPREFLDAVERRFGAIGWDLAATKANSVAGPDKFIGPDHGYETFRDALTIAWDTRWLNWLNPPYSNIAAFAKKASEESKRGARIAMLVPCGNQRWWMEYVQPYAYEFRLFPRLTFVGHSAPYPKDLNLYLYDRGITGSQPWEWRK